MCTNCMVDYQAANTGDGSAGGSPAAAGTVSDYTALLRYYDSANTRWNGPTDVGTPVVVTYSFKETPDLPSLSTYNPYSASAYWSFNESQRASYREALSKFEAVAGIKFVEIETDAMVNVFGANVSGVGGWASYAYSSDFSTGSGNFVNAYSSMASGAYGFQVNLHEMGHAMGLKHPHEGGTLTLESSQDTQENTVMTYNVKYPYAQDLGPMDALALSHLYGSASATDGWTVTAVDGDTVKIVTTQADETIIATDVHTVIFANWGNDEVIGREGTDKILGGRGNDTIQGSYGNDTLVGGRDDDVIYGGFDATDGSGRSDESDILRGGAGSDSMYGGNGDDKLFGGNEADLMKGGLGADRLFGGTGADSLYGGSGKDTISGGGGNDRIEGGADADFLVGKSGSDIFVFTSADAYTQDCILDFEIGVDKIDLTAFSYMSWSTIDLEDIRGVHARVSYSDWFDIKLYNFDVATLTESDFLFAA